MQTFEVVCTNEQQPDGSRVGTLTLPGERVWQARIPTPGDKFYEVGEKYVVSIA
jgi:hypothetical protein